MLSHGYILRTNLSLNGQFDGCQTRKRSLRCFFITTPLTPIPARITELLLISNSYSTNPAGLCSWTFSQSS